MVAKNSTLGYDNIGLNKLGGFAVCPPEDDENDEDEDKKPVSEDTGGDSGWIEPPEVAKRYVFD